VSPCPTAVPVGWVPFTALVSGRSAATNFTGVPGWKRACGSCGSCPGRMIASFPAASAARGPVRAAAGVWRLRHVGCAPGRRERGAGLPGRRAAVAVAGGKLVGDHPDRLWDRGPPNAVVDRIDLGVGERPASPRLQLRTKKVDPEHALAAAGELQWNTGVVTTAVVGFLEDDFRRGSDAEGPTPQAKVVGEYGVEFVGDGGENPRCDLGGCAGGL